MIDAHTHIHDKQFNKDRDAVITRAFEGGVKKMLAIGTDITESRKAIIIAERYENIWAVVGIHPDFFNVGTIEKEFPISNFQFPNKIQELEKLLFHPKVVGIGEVGLDYYSHTGERITEGQKKAQREGFLAQMELAQKYNLPLVIHTRPSSRESDDAYEDVSYLLGQTSNVNGRMFVLHSYQGSVSMTEKFLAMPDIYFSFAGNSTYPVKRTIVGGEYDIRESIKIIPSHRLLTETDCPYLAPQPVRGLRNEPIYVHFVVEEIAKIKGASIEEVEKSTEETFEKIFGITI